MPSGEQESRNGGGSTGVGRTAFFRYRAAFLAAGVVCVLAAPKHYGDRLRTANEQSRTYAAMALGQEGSLALDPILDREHPGWRQSGRVPAADVSERGGHYYTDKGPLLPLLAAPIAASVARPLGYGWLTWLLALLLAAVPLGLAAALGRRWLDDADHKAGWFSIALVLASPLAVYGGLFFSHAAAAAAVFAGAALALGPPAAATVSSRRSAVAGGALLGLAVLAEATAALAVVAVVVAVLTDPERRGRLGAIVLGGAGPAIVLALWNTLAFGAPWAMSYGFKANAEFAATHARGIYGIGVPSAESVWGLFFSARRGLFFMAPWLLAPAIGAVAMVRDRDTSRAWRVLSLLAWTALPLVVCGFGDWHGGRSVGPRYLLFALLLTAPAAAWSYRRYRSQRWFPVVGAAVFGLVCSSALVSMVAAYGFPYPSETLTNPLFEVNLPVILDRGPAQSAVPVLPAAAALGLAAVAWLALVVATAPRRLRPTGLVPIAAAVGCAVLHATIALSVQSPASARDEIRSERELTVRLLRELRLEAPK